MQQKNKLEPNVRDLLNLEDFDISESRGFLQNTDPLLSLPSEFKALDQIALVLPKLNEQEKLRKAIHNFPFFEDIDKLEGSELNRAMMIYHFIQSSYVLAPENMDYSVNPPRIIDNKIPKQIAVPSYKLTKKFGNENPILKYWSYALSNYTFHVPSEGFKMENIETILKFTDSKDENGFIRVHVLTEANFAPNLIGIGPIKFDMLYKSPVNVEMKLHEGGENIINNVIPTLQKMFEECDPNEYYKTVRPWIQKFDNIVYESVEEYKRVPMSFRGETGAQMSIIPSLDAALSIKHEEDGHLNDMLYYMPPKHKMFIELCSQKPSIRDYVIKHKNTGVKDAYNGFLESIALFRETHNSFQNPYIVSKVPGETQGTGGTPFQPWLLKRIEETRASKIY